MSNLKTKNEVIQWLVDKGVKNFEINEDLSVNVLGDVNLRHNCLSALPVKFFQVGGDFDISDNYLKDLSNTPRHVGLMFNCAHNTITNLEEGPLTVGTHYRCADNQLRSLKGVPLKMRGFFDCSSNFLNSLQYGPEDIGSGFYEASENPLETLDFMPLKVNGDIMLYNTHIDKIKLIFSCSTEFNGILAVSFSKANPKKVDFQVDPDFSPAMHVVNGDLKFTHAELNIFREQYFLKQGIPTNNSFEAQNLVKNKKNDKI